MMQVKPYDAALDYDEVESWRMARGQSKLPVGFFPDIGVVVYDDKTEEDLCAAWLYEDKAGRVCWIAHLVTRPHINFNDSLRAIEIAIDYLSSIAKEEGFKFVMTSTKLPSLIDTFKAMGFISGEEDKGHQFLAKVL